MKTVSMSTLPKETDELITRAIGGAIAVHKALGPGFLESIYVRALAVEFGMSNIPFECERPIVVNYRGTAISGQRIDLIVGGEVIIEVKAVARIDPIFQAKLMSYLRTTKLRAGLLINFNVPLLKEGIQRIVL